MKSREKLNKPVAESLSAAWFSFRLNLRKLFRHESQAMRAHWDGAQTRVSAATQAGDVPTLVRDQLQLLPDSQERLQAHWQGSFAIVRQALLDWYKIGYNYWNAAFARLQERSHRQQ